MAAPTFTAGKASAISNDTGGAWSHTTAAPSAAGQLIVVHVFQDGSTVNAIDIASATNANKLDGSGTGYTPLLVTSGPYTGYRCFPTYNDNGFHYIFFARSTGTSASVITGTNTGSDDIYIRTYQFGGVHTGPTVAHIIENGTAGTANSEAGRSASVTDVAVAALGNDRLALNFIAVADEVQAAELTAMTGMTGGTWAYPVAATGSSTGTDGSLGLVSATLATGGTIDGGSDAITTEDWGVIGFALRPTSAILTLNGTVVTPITFGAVTSGTRSWGGNSPFEVSIAATADDGTALRYDPSYPPDAGGTGSGNAGITPTKTFATPNYTVQVGLLRFDTSPIPDAATITGATLRIYVISTANVDARSLTAEWYDWSPAIDIGDYTSTVGTNAHSGTPISTLTNGSHDLALTNYAANVSKTGYSYLRLHVSGAAPTGGNFVDIEDLSAAAGHAAQLTVTFTVGAATLYGTVVTPVTGTIVTAGKVDEHAQVVTPVIATVVTAGRVTSRNNTVVTPVTATIVTSGRAVRKATVVTPITASIVTAGRNVLRGRVVTPTTATFVTAGRVTAKATVVTPVTLNRVTTGKVTAKAAVATPITATVTTTGRNVLRGQVVTPITVGIVTNGVATTPAATLYGTVVTPITAGVTTAGVVTAKSAVVTPITINITTNAAAAGGQSTLPIAASITTAGIVTAKGTVVTPVTVTIVETGHITSHGTVTTPITLQRETNGTRTRLAQIVTALTATFVTAGKRTTYGQTIVPITFGAVTAGTSFSGGRTTLPITLSISSSGKITARGAVTLPLTAGRVTAGTVTATSRILFPLTLDAATAARVAAFGRVDLPITLKIVSGPSAPTGQALIGEILQGRIGTLDLVRRGHLDIGVGHLDHDREGALA